MLTVAEYARLEGITDRRARKLAETGVIPARRHGRSWVIEDAALGRESQNVRPMGEQMRHTLIRALGDPNLTGLTGSTRSRAAGHLRKLRESENPAALIRAWFRDAAPPTGYKYGEVIVRDAMEGRDDRVAAVVRKPLRRFVNTNTKLASVVRAERAISGISRDALAKRAGVDRVQIDAIESAKPITSIPAVRSTLRALKVEPLALPPVNLKSRRS